MLVPISSDCCSPFRSGNPVAPAPAPVDGAPKEGGTAPIRLSTALLSALGRPFDPRVAPEALAPGRLAPGKLGKSPGELGVNGIAGPAALPFDGSFAANGIAPVFSGEGFSDGRSIDGGAIPVDAPIEGCDVGTPGKAGTLNWSEF